jgi:hypothetical protein
MQSEQTSSGASQGSDPAISGMNIAEIVDRYINGEHYLIDGCTESPDPHLFKTAAVGWGTSVKNICICTRCGRSAQGLVAGGL